MRHVALLLKPPQVARHEAAVPTTIPLVPGSTWPRATLHTVTTMNSTPLTETVMKIMPMIEAGIGMNDPYRP